MERQWKLNLSGGLHERLSRQRIKKKREDAQALGSHAKSPGEVHTATRRHDRLSGELLVRNFLSVVTTPLDALAGTGRQRGSNQTASQAIACHPCDLGLVPAVGVAALLGSTTAAAMVGGAVGLPVGASMGHAGAGVTAGAAAVSVPVAAVGALVLSTICQVFALPSAVIKAAGTGVGALGGGVYGLAHAQHTAQMFRKGEVAARFR